jgi:dTDP-glucose 4,6-dehydratase
MTQTHQPKTLLVTGAAGFIGANFIHYWLAAHPEHKLIAYDALTYAGNLQNLTGLKNQKNFSFVHGDILDQALVENLLKNENIDTLVHFAAESHVDRSIHGPDSFIKTNIEGTHSLLKAAKLVWLDKHVVQHRFHHVSTDEVYGSLDKDEPPFDENHQYAPNSPYAASKASSDHIVRAYHETFGLNITTSNCSNNYGPYQFPEKLIPLIIANCVDGKALPIYGDGKQIRDWLYVDDHNQGIDKIIHNGTSGEVYNIGGNNEWTNIDIVNLVCKIMDSHLPQGAPHSKLITYVDDRLGHDRRYAINATKINESLNYTPLETFETGIVKTVEWYLRNEDWWRNIMDKSYREWITKNYLCD